MTRALDHSAHDDLIKAALAFLDTEGVLGGLNVSTIARTAGVTPANVYHLFGSRRGLLREAIRTEIDRQISDVASAGELPLAPHRLAIFDLILASPMLTTSALLALDQDPDYEPLPFVEATFAGYQQLKDDGELPEDLDVEALHLLTLATSIGTAIFAKAASRQLGDDHDDLVARVRALLGQLLEGLTTSDPSQPST